MTQEDPSQKAILVIQYSYFICCGCASETETTTLPTLKDSEKNIPSYRNKTNQTKANGKQDNICSQAAACANARGIAGGGVGRNTLGCWKRGIGVVGFHQKRKSESGTGSLD